MKTLMKIAGAVLLVFTLSACWPENTSTKVSKSVDEQQRHYSIGQPVPKFDWSLERDLIIQLYRARNTEVATHTVWRSNYGVVEGDCQSIGFGLPYDTSLTNPLTLQKVNNQYGVVLEQPEPNGIFASKNSNATWVMCVIEEGGRVTTAPIYVESKVTVYPFEVAVDYATNRVTRVSGSQPSVTIEGR